jgi:uncharacterized membrane protein
VEVIISRTKKYIWKERRDFNMQMGYQNKSSKILKIMKERRCAGEID